jgi:hypothetical protein
MITINTTFKIEEYMALAFENNLRQNFEVISFRHVPDTEKLWENDKHFQRIVKEIKNLQKLRDEYINEHG